MDAAARDGDRGGDREGDYERLVSRQAAAATAAACEVASLARRLRQRGEEQLDAAEGSDPDTAAALQAAGSRTVARADELERLLECQRMTAHAASEALDQRA